MAVSTRRLRLLTPAYVAVNPLTGPALSAAVAIAPHAVGIANWPLPTEVADQMAATPLSASSIPHVLQFASRTGIIAAIKTAHARSDVLSAIAAYTSHDVTLNSEVLRAARFAASVIQDSLFREGGSISDDMLCVAADRFDRLSLAAPSVLAAMASDSSPAFRIELASRPPSHSASGEHAENYAPGAASSTPLHYGPVVMLEDPKVRTHLLAHPELANEILNPFFVRALLGSHDPAVHEWIRAALALGWLSDAAPAQHAAFLNYAAPFMFEIVYNPFMDADLARALLARLGMEPPAHVVESPYASELAHAAANGTDLPGTVARDSAERLAEWFWNANVNTLHGYTPRGVGVLTLISILPLATQKRVALRSDIHGVTTGVPPAVRRRIEPRMLLPLRPTSARFAYPRPDPADGSSRYVLPQFRQYIDEYTAVHVTAESRFTDEYEWRDFFMLLSAGVEPSAAIDVVTG